jgi:hypothetical protein
VADTSVTRLLRGAARRLGLRDSKPPHHEAELSHARRYWDDKATLTLSDLVKPGETKASGRVNYIALTDFRAAIGPLWMEYRDRIVLIAETTIARMIGKGRTFIPIAATYEPDDIDTWLLLCPDLAEGEASAHADMIAERIGEKLVGAHFLGQDPPLPKAAMLDLTGVVGPNGEIDLQALKTAVAKSRSAQASAAAEQRSGAAPRLHANAVLRSAWTMETETENSFFLRPVSVTGDELISAQASVWPESVVHKLLETAGRLVTQMAQAGLRAKLAVPIPYALLYTPVAAQVREAIAAMPKQARLHHLRLEITRIPNAAPSQQLAALREIFRPTVCQVAFLVDAFAPCDGVFDLDNIVIGADLTTERGWDEADLRIALAALRDGALHCPSYVLGLRNREHVRMAISSGIHEIGGQSIAGDSDALPDKLRVIPRAALLTP